jgi:hypothetical protein
MNPLGNSQDDLPLMSTGSNKFIMHRGQCLICPEDDQG